MKEKKLGILILSMVMCLILVGCAGKKLSLTSNDWEYETGGFTYHFDKDGNGTYVMGAGKPLEFTYVDNGNSITITYKTNKSKETLKYKIKGKKLTIVDRFGNNTVYIKK